jgi:hypothetical protein
MGTCRDCSAASYWLPTYVLKKERERQAGQHCYLKTLIWCLSLQVTPLRYGARSRSGHTSGWNSPASYAARGLSGSASTELGGSRQDLSRDMHLPCAPRAPAGLQAAEVVVNPEEPSLPMCQALISDDREGG